MGHKIVGADVRRRNAKHPRGFRLPRMVLEVQVLVVLCTVC